MLDSTFKPEPVYLEDYYNKRAPSKYVLYGLISFVILIVLLKLFVAQ